MWQWLTEPSRQQRGRVPLRAPLSVPEYRTGLLQEQPEASEASGSVLLADNEEHKFVKRRMENPMWTLDRGTGYYQRERRDKKKASLMGTGKEAGKLMLSYVGVRWSKVVKHVWKKDFFTTAIHAKFGWIIVGMFFFYFSTFLLWGSIYYATWIWDNTCFIGFDSFQSAFLFAIETQQTIGYGTHAIGDCWLPAWMVGVHCMMALLMDAIFIGIVFAKVSHPKSRSRTILISESCCIARRNGVLKLMFRVADIRKRTAIQPRVKAALYTWPQRRTAEGETIPVMAQDLCIHYQDPLMLLPVVIEHTIDERSPLYGHTAQTLEAAGAEIVVVFEGVNELGDSFTARQSYLPGEIHWGHVFVNILERAPPGMTQHIVNLARFHDVEPQEGLALLPPLRLSRWVVNGGSRKVPFSRLGENTLVASDELCVCPRNGRMLLVARLGDSYPSQMINVNVRMFVFRYAQRYSSEGEQLPYDMQELCLLQPQVMLRYPVEVAHDITDGSPIASWATSDGILQDADAEVVLTVTAVKYCTSTAAMRSKVYPVLGGIKWGWAFVPCVTPPTLSQSGRTQVHWEAFHTMQPIHPQAQSRRATTTRHTSPRDDTYASAGDPNSTHNSGDTWTYNSTGRGQAHAIAAGPSSSAADAAARGGRGADGAGFSGRPAKHVHGLPPLPPLQRPYQAVQKSNVDDQPDEGSYQGARDEPSFAEMPLASHIAFDEDTTAHAKVRAWQDDHTLTLPTSRGSSWVKKRSLASIFPLFQQAMEEEEEQQQEQSGSTPPVGASSSSGGATGAWRAPDADDEEQGGGGGHAAPE